LAELKRQKKEAEEAEKKKAASENPALKGLSLGEQLKILKQ